MNGAAPFLVVICALAGCGLATLYLALATVGRSAVEELAREDVQHPARSRRRMARIGVIFDSVESHCRAVGLLQLTCAAGTVLGLVGWSARALGREVPGEVDVLVGMVASVAVLWVFHVLLPLSLASIAGPRVLYNWSRLLRAADAALLPLRPAGKIADALTKRLNRLTRQERQEEVQEEILQVVQEGATSGVLDQQDKQMIEAVVQFGDLTVHEVMTPRSEIEGMELTNDLGEVIRTVRTLGHSRIPVYSESLDHIVGMFYVKDLMHWLAGETPVARGGVGEAMGPVTARSGGPRAFELRSILRPALMVPESKTVRELLRELMQQKVHIAIAVDEHGSTAGLVTFEDIVETIVGDIRDEYEVPAVDQPEVLLNARKGWVEIMGAARVDEANAELARLGIGTTAGIGAGQGAGGAEVARAGDGPDGGGEADGAMSGGEVPTPIQLPESEDYSTVSGLIVTTMGHVPGPGEKVAYERYELEVLEAMATRVLKVALRVTDRAGGAEGAGRTDGQGTEATGRAMSR